MVKAPPPFPVRVTVPELILRYRCTPSAVSLTDLEPLLAHHALLEEIFVTAVCGVAIFDAPRASYRYVSHSLEHLLGYPADAYFRGGLEFAFSIVHPDDVPGVVQILANELDLLKTLPVERRLEHRSSYDYRFRRVDGTYLRVWQRNVLLDLAPDGSMRHMLLLVTDITHLKKDDSKLLNLNMERDALITYTYDTRSKMLEECHLLSPREREVLALLSQGRSSKEIADGLHLSVHTVETHRRNMLAKTNMRDTTSLLTFALTAGLL